MKKLGVLVGCNYPNTPNELHGCINDVLAMHESLVKRFGFDPQDIVVLIDGGSPTTACMPTGANIKKALARMVDRAEPGDVLFFHFSGHGTLIPSLSPTTHPFRHDEAIVPCDFNLITDMDFRELVNRVPKGATFTVLSDSCHSGGLIDKEKEQIGPSTKSITTTTNTTNSKEDDNHYTRISDLSLPKTIPFESILGHLASLTQINCGDIGTHLLELFGSDCSLRFRFDPKVVLAEMEDVILKPLQPDEGILLSGCQKDETCADIRPSKNGSAMKKAYGAFSHAVQTVFEENNNDSGCRLTNREVVFLARKVLQSQQNLEQQQHPCLYCSDENADTTFLGLKNNLAKI
ncbi:hypothetical protein LguiA_003464 [Lonicera macranthoides]